MTTTVNYSLTDYLAMARLVHDSAGDEPRTYEVEYKTKGCTLHLDIRYDFDAHEERGGSYGGYQFERIGVVDSEEYDVFGYTCLDADGEPVKTDFTARRLLDILN